MMQVFKRQNNLRCVEASVWLTEKAVLNFVQLVSYKGHDNFVRSCVKSVMPKYILSALYQAGAIKFRQKTEICFRISRIRNY